ncbi:hypothetical protein ACFOD0_11570 [Shewanella intestini]|uniref:Uncharacterized protein n=1 Tax=Shewanella intestini TaxID=2017544 RepID=A0ABS5I311_9GAMM|nr:MULTISPECIES: hypothetical protein [Shewanella]MBR9728422.1 hypothetical protein [Shewanella intestini]MRG36764.1 hypothetical protein [Shewanella sp. XMDDZSB0408]
MLTTTRLLNYTTPLLLSLSLVISGCVVSKPTTPDLTPSAKTATTNTAANTVIKQPQPIPALVAKVTPQSHAEIAQAIAQLLSLKQVRIAQSAFSQHHQLTLEHAAHKDANGNLIMGRSTAMPEQFSLFIEHGQCILRRDINLAQVALVNTQCREK